MDSDSKIKLYPWSDKIERLKGNKNIYYKKGYKYQLFYDFWIKLPFKPKNKIKTWFIEFNIDGWLLIKRGYAWDGPSGPTIDTKTFMRGSLVHDVLYQLIRMCILDHTYKEKADEILHRIIREDSMFWIRASYVKEAMKFSDFATNPKNKKEILIAPKL